MYKYYVAIAVRWGDPKGHSYPIVATDDVFLANLFGTCEYYYRGSKYNHIIKVLYSEHELEKIYVNYIANCSEDKKIIFYIFGNEFEKQENIEYLTKIKKDKNSRVYSYTYEIYSVKNLEKQLQILEGNDIDYFESVLNYTQNEKEEERLKLIYETFLREKQKNEQIIDWINQTNELKGLETYTKYKDDEVINSIINHSQSNANIVDKLFYHNFEDNVKVLRILLRSSLKISEQDFVKIIFKYSIEIKPSHFEYPFFEINKYSDDFYLKYLNLIMIEKDKKTGWFNVIYNLKSFVKNKNISFNILNQILILLESIKNNKVSDSSLNDLDDLTAYHQLINIIKTHQNYIDDASIISELLKN